MSSDISLGLSGILAARQAITTIGQNIANSATPGYARREVRLTSRSWSVADARNAGGGVTVDHVDRVRDMFLAEQLRSHKSGLESSETRSRYLAEVEALIQEPGTEGIGAALNRFFNQWQSVASQPENNSERNSLLLTAADLANQITTLRQGLTDLRASIQGEVTDIVREVNQLTASIVNVNNLSAQSAGSDGGVGLGDERDRAMAELARLVGARDISPHDATATVLVGGSLLVEGTSQVQLLPPTDFNSPLRIGTGSDSGPIEAPGGSLAALITLNRETIPSYINRLDELASGLIRSVNSLHSTGKVASGPFTDMTAALAASDADGDGDAGNDLLAAAFDLPMEVGSFRINVTELASGAVTNHDIAINPATQSLNDVASALNALGNLSATITNGRLRIQAASGYGFDFAGPQSAGIPTGLGLNAFFGGSDASSIAVAERLVGNPELIAAGETNDAGDGAVAAAISETRNTNLPDLQATGPETWRNFISGVGADSASARDLAIAQDGMVSLLNQQDQAVSGVSLDEEGARLMQFQEMFTACARYLSTISRLNDLLIQYL